MHPIVALAGQQDDECVIASVYEKPISICIGDVAEA
jgi:hypothetical protein